MKLETRKFKPAFRLHRVLLESVVASKLLSSQPESGVFADTSGSFHGYRLRKIPWLIDVATPTHTDVIGQQLERHNREYWGNQVGGGRYFDHLVGDLPSLGIV